MAVVREGNVFIASSTGGVISGPVTFDSVKYIGGASGVCTIEGAAGAGDVLWQESGTANVFNQVSIHDGEGVEVIITGTATVYLYSRI